MILAGDIGGTNSRMALAEMQDGRLRIVTGKDYPGREFTGLESVIRTFLTEFPTTIEAACMAIAGPIRDGAVNATNLPWKIVATDLAAVIGTPQVHLINDLEANGIGIAALEPADFVVIQPGSPDAVGNQCVISAGTGLGEAGIFWDGKKHHVFACEGGHTDFAPRNELEMDLLRYLIERFGRVSYERILSGPGLVNVYQFLRDTKAMF